MGCDIHFYVEKRKGGRWVSADTWVNPDGYTVVENPYYSDRNYYLFSILADVRNGRGFAGVKTGEGFNPISKPRGVPEDASPEYKREVDGMGIDGHSHSWITLQELLDYDWTQETTLHGWVDFKTWERWYSWNRQRGIGPENYCGEVSGGSTKRISAIDMDTICTAYREITAPSYRADFAAQYESTYALAVWKTPYYRAAGSLMDETIPRLLKLAGGTKGAADVRIVFFFDN